MLPDSAGAFVLFPASKVYKSTVACSGVWVGLFFPLTFSGGARAAAERTKPRGKNSTKKREKKKVGAVKKEVSVPGRDIIYSFNAFIQRAEVVFTLS